MAKKDTFRVVTRAEDGSLQIRDYPTVDPLLQTHTQIGIDDCSTDLALRGMPIFRGLVGPMPESKTIVRYESVRYWPFHCLPNSLIANTGEPRNIRVKTARASRFIR